MNLEFSQIVYLMHQQNYLRFQLIRLFLHNFALKRENGIATDFLLPQQQYIAMLQYLAYPIFFLIDRKFRQVQLLLLQNLLAKYQLFVEQYQFYLSQLLLLQSQLQLTILQRSIFLLLQILLLQFLLQHSAQFARLCAPVRQLTLSRKNRLYLNLLNK